MATAPSPQPPQSGATTPRSRLLWSLVLVFHLVGMGASLTKKTAVGAAIREVTGPTEKLLGIWQSWGMFGPNPPLGTSWLKVVGTTRSGQEVDLPAPVGQKDADRTDWHYDRLAKVERNMFDKKNHSLRRGYAGYLCRSWPDEDPLVTVAIRKDRTMTPKPGHRGGPADIRHIPLDSFACEELSP